MLQNVIYYGELMKILMYRSKIVPWDVKPLVMTGFEIETFEMIKSSRYDPFLKKKLANKGILDYIFASRPIRAIGVLCGSSIDCNPFALYSQIMTKRPEIIYTVEDITLSSYVAAFTKEKINSKFIFTSWENKFRPKWNPLRKIVFEKADAITTPSISTKELMIKEFPSFSEKVHWIPGAVDTNRFCPNADKSLRTTLSLDDKFVILFVGSLIKRKGIDYLIRAFNRLHSKRPNAVLVLSGDGEDKQEFCKLVSQLNLQNNIIFLGPTDYNEVHKVFSICDIFCLPSVETFRWKEQFGFVIIQAMACGKPIVGTNSGAIPEVIGDAGIIVPERDDKRLAEAFESLLSEGYRSKLGNIARKRAETIYSMSVVSRQFKNLFENVVKNKKTNPLASNGHLV